MQSDNVCVVTLPDDSIMVVDAPKNEEKPSIIWKNVGIFGLEVVGLKKIILFHR